MKRLLVSLLLAGAFLGGYQLGRRPDSPDIVGWASEKYHWAAQVTESLLPPAKTGSDDQAQPAAERHVASAEPAEDSGGKIAIVINGKRYLIGGQILP